MRHGTAGRAISFLLLIAAGYYLFAVLGIGQAATETWMDSHVRGQGISGIFVYIALVTALTAVGIPRQLCSFLGGYVYGMWYGALWATIGTALACCLCFAYARFLGQHWLHQRLGHKLENFNFFLNQSPFILTLMVRIIPLGSNFLTNFLAGISRIPALPFLGGSFAGFSIQNLIFAMLGSGLHIASTWRTAGSAVLYAASLGMGYVIYKKYKACQQIRSKGNAVED